MKTFILILLVLTFTSCSGLSEKRLKKICNYNSAFNIGHHDAKEKKKIQVQNWADDCPKEVRRRVVNGYRTGYFSYKDELANSKVIQGTRISKEKQCIKRYDKEVCGYNCVEAFNEVRCARHPDFRCFEKSGEIVCGYKCKELYGEVSCAKYERP